MEVEVVGAIQLPDVERMRGFGGRPPRSGIDGIPADEAIPHNPSYSVGGVAMGDNKRVLDAAVKMDPYCVLQSGKESVKTKRAHGMQLPSTHAIHAQGSCGVCLRAYSSPLDDWAQAVEGVPIGTRP